MRSRWRPRAPHLVLSISAFLAFGGGMPGTGLLARAQMAHVREPRAPGEAVVISSSRVQEEGFRSQSLDRDMRYTIFLPPGYDSSPSARYPVLYMLHGLGGDRTQWVRAGLLTTAADLMQRGEIAPFIIVLPEGERGYWVDHANNGPRFGSYVSRDLVTLIDRQYRTVATRDARAIGGMSMGGHGALQLALNNPQTFRVVGAHSVVLRTKEQAFECFGDRQYFQAHDPVSIIQNQPDVARQLVLSIDIGDGDPWEPAAAAFHRQLLAQGLDHQWSVGRGEHNDAYWAARVAGYLRFYGGALQGRLATTGS